MHIITNHKKDLSIAGLGGQNLSWVCRTSLVLLGPAPIATWSHNPIFEF